MQLEELTVKIDADIGDLQRDMRRVENEVGKVSQTVDQRTVPALGRLSNVITGVGAAIAGSAILRLGGDLIGLAADAEEAGSKFETVFGDATESMNEWIAALRESVPATTAQLQAMAAGIQDLLGPLGIAPAAATEMSKSIVQLAADLASFNNIPIDEALQRLQSGLVGQFEPLLKFGVALNAAVVEAKALELGLITEGEALDAASRAQAAFALILEGTTKAQGDAARTADSAANSTRFMVAELKEAATVIGASLLPVVRDLGRTFRENSTEIQSFARVAARAITEILDVFQGAFIVIGGLRSGFVELFDLIQDTARSIETFVRARLASIAEGAAGLIELLPGQFGIEQALVGGLRNYARAQRDTLNEMFFDWDRWFGAIETRSEDTARTVRQNLDLAVPGVSGGAPGAIAAPPSLVEIPEISLTPEAQAVIDAIEAGEIAIPIPKADALIADIQRLQQLGVGGLEGAQRAAGRRESAFNLALDRALQGLVDTITVYNREIGGALADLVQGEASFGDTLSTIGQVVLSGLGSALDTIAPGLGSLLSGFFESIFGPSETARNNQAIRDSIDSLFREAVVLGEVPGVEPTIQAFRDLDDEIRNVGVKLKDSGISAQTAIDAVSENFDFLVEQFRQGATIQEATDALLEKIRQDLQETDEGISDVNDSIQETADTLTNAPQGFKVALARFNATVADAAAVPAALGTPAATTTMRDQFHIEQLTINAAPGESGEDLLVRIEKAAAERSVRGGTVVFARTRAGTI